RSAVSVIVHPDDHDLVAEALPSLPPTIEGALDITLRSDAAIERGGCTVAGADGRIDATLPTQLERIVEALLPGPRLLDDAHDAHGVGEIAAAGMPIDAPTPPHERTPPPVTDHPGESPS